MILLVLNNNVKICNKTNENIIISYFKYYLEISMPITDLQRAVENEFIEIEIDHS